MVRSFNRCLFYTYSPVLRSKGIKTVLPLLSGLIQSFAFFPTSLFHHQLQPCIVLLLAVQSLHAVGAAMTSPTKRLSFSSSGAISPPVGSTMSASAKRVSFSSEVKSHTINDDDVPSSSQSVKVNDETPSPSTSAKDGAPSQTRSVNVKDGAISPSRSLNDGAPSSPSPTRRLSRNYFTFLCRYGWYPILVASTITGACLLDLYSSMSCEFLKVNVNTDTGETRGHAFIGIYYRQSGSAFESGVFGDYLAEGCQAYSDEFETNVIAHDRTWQATRYLGMISAVSGGVAAVMAWLLVVTPIPASCIWSGIMLPLLPIAFLGEGTKFLFLDANICTAPLWYKHSTDCELGTTAYFAIAACVVLFLCLVMACVWKPQLRTPKGSQVQNMEGRDGNDVESQKLPLPEPQAQTSLRVCSQVHNSVASHGKEQDVESQRSPPPEPEARTSAWVSPLQDVESQRSPPPEPKGRTSSRLVSPVQNAKASHGMGQDVESQRSPQPEPEGRTASNPRVPRDPEASQRTPVRSVGKPSRTRFPRDPESQAAMVRQGRRPSTPRTPIDP